MRSREYLLCSVCIVAVMLLALPVGAEDPAPAEGCDLGFWDAVVDYFGPVDCAVPNDPADPAYLVPDSDGLCTGVQYTVNGTKPLAHSAILAYNPAFLYPLNGYVDARVGPSGTVQALCVGDEATNSGVGSCHEQAIRFNPDDVVDGPFWFVVEGLRQPSATTLTLKANKTFRCEIKGVGDLVDENVLPAGCVPSCGNFNPDQTLTKTEKLNFHGCEVVFEFDLNTGEVVDAFLTQESQDNDCDFDEGSVAELELKVDNVSFGFGKFGDGMISTGGNTCSCRVIGGRWWCWGRPCPD